MLLTLIFKINKLTVKILEKDNLLLFVDIKNLNVMTD